MYEISPHTRTADCLFRGRRAWSVGLRQLQSTAGGAVLCTPTLINWETEDKTHERYGGFLCLPFPALLAASLSCVSGNLATSRPQSLVRQVCVSLYIQLYGVGVSSDCTSRAIALVR